MRISLLLVSLLIIVVLVVAAPAIAQQVSQTSVQTTGSDVTSCSTTVQNGQGMVQYRGMVNGVEVSGSIPIQGPNVVVDCRELIEQAAAARQAEPATTSPKTGANELPRTGGSGTMLVGLGVGTLLVAGGLLTLRVIR